MRCYRCVPDPSFRARKVTFRVGTLLTIAALVFWWGSCHIVHGGGAGLQFCEKDGWYISDTVVDLDDYVGKPLLSVIDRAKIVRALVACKVLVYPDAPKSE